MVTEELLRSAVPRCPTDSIDELTVLLNEALVEFGITTRQRVAMFLAQSDIETGGLTAMSEGWNGKGDQRNYEDRSSLGNTQAGDGFRYRGRGAFQITGREAYTMVGAKLHEDLVNHPELAATPRLAFRTAGAWWQIWHFERFADRGDVDRVTRILNGPRMLGKEDRRRSYHRALAVLPEGWTLDAQAVKRARAALDKSKELRKPGGLIYQVAQQYEALVRAYAEPRRGARRLAPAAVDSFARDQAARETGLWTPLDIAQASLAHLYAVLFGVLSDPQYAFTATMKQRMHNTLSLLTNGGLGLVLFGRYPARMTMTGRYQADVPHILESAAADAAFPPPPLLAWDKLKAWSEGVRRRIIGEGELRLLGQHLRKVAPLLRAGASIPEAEIRQILVQTSRLRAVLHGSANHLQAGDRAILDGVLRENAGFAITVREALELDSAASVREHLAPKRRRRRTHHAAAGAEAGEGGLYVDLPETTAGSARLAVAPVFLGPSSPVGLTARLADAGLISAPRGHVGTPVPPSPPPATVDLDQRIHEIVEARLSRQEEHFLRMIESAS